MNKKNNPRQIRYNMQTDTAEQELLRHYWTFFILNERREASRIQQKVINYFGGRDFASCDELTELESGILIREGSLRGKLVTLKSNAGALPPKAKEEIYATNKWYRDRTLKPMSDIQFDTYAARFKK
ncbi:hypothetical protein HNV12_02905 [Methanococcoides sp. SA1]|nr:hypothetical protein [Methanococcoides sp. SA1]